MFSAGLVRFGVKTFLTERLKGDSEVMRPIPGMTAPRGELRKGERGGVMAEFAIILPALVLILFGVVEFALIMYDKAVITNASREGARLASLYYPDSTDPTARVPDAQVQTAVMNYAASYLITFGGDTLDTSDIQVDPPALDANSQWVRRVVVNYQYGFLVLPNFVTSITGPLNLTAVTVMRDENQTTPGGS